MQNGKNEHREKDDRVLLLPLLRVHRPGRHVRRDIRQGDEQLHRRDRDDRRDGVVRLRLRPRRGAAHDDQRGDRAGPRVQRDRVQAVGLAGRALPDVQCGELGT